MQSIRITVIRCSISTSLSLTLSVKAQRAQLSDGLFNSAQSRSLHRFCNELICDWLVTVFVVVFALLRSCSSPSVWLSAKQQKVFCACIGMYANIACVWRRLHWPLRASIVPSLSNQCSLNERHTSSATQGAQQKTKRKRTEVACSERKRERVSMIFLRWISQMERKQSNDQLLLASHFCFEW